VSATVFGPKATLSPSFAGDGSGLKVRNRKLKHYRLSLTMLQERLPGSPLVAALAAELDALSDAEGVRAHSHGASRH
jgi:hypothetical protein